VSKEPDDEPKKTKTKMKNKKNEEEKAEEVARRSAVAELAQDTGNTRKVASSKEGFFRFPPSMGRQLIEETSEDEVSLVAQAPRAKKRKSGRYFESHLEMNHELRTATMADLGAEQIRGANEVVKVAETSGNLKGTYVKALKKAAKFFTLNATEMARRADSAHGVVAIMVARMMAMEAEIAALTKELASHFATEKSGESPVAAIECEIEELGTALTGLIRETPTRHQWEEGNGGRLRTDHEKGEHWSSQHCSDQG
jgi:hypothetical protein